MQTNKNKYYGILGLTPSCSEDDIKAAYRKLAKEWHPDINKSPEATEKFKEIQKAYEMVSNSPNTPPFDAKAYDVFGDVLNRRGIDGLWKTFFETKTRSDRNEERISRGVIINLEFDNLSHHDAEKLLRTLRDAGYNFRRYSIIRGM